MLARSVGVKACLQIASSTVTKSVTGSPLLVRHEMVKVVAPESGTVAAPPLNALSLKLPSGLETGHDSTPFEFQNTNIRVPSATLAATAQMTTAGSPTEI